MHQVDNETTTPECPPFEKTIRPGWFTKGGQGQAATYPGADWFNMVQAELLNVLKAANILPNKNTLTQLADAVVKLSTDSAQNAVDNTYLQINLNLSDVKDKVAARKALDVLNTSEVDSRVTAAKNEAENALAQHAQAADPHSQYMTSAETQTTISDKIWQHEAQDNPHGQYATHQNVTGQVNDRMAQHELARDPHAQYTTADELNTAINQHRGQTDAHESPRIKTDIVGVPGKTLYETLIKLNQQINVNAQPIQRTYERIFEDATGLQTGTINLTKSFREFDEIFVVGGTDSRVYISPYKFTPAEYDIITIYKPTSFDLWMRDSASWRGYFSTNTTFTTTGENARIFAIYGVLVK